MNESKRQTRLLKENFYGMEKECYFIIFFTNFFSSFLSTFINDLNYFQLWFFLDNEVLKNKICLEKLNKHINNIKTAYI